MKMKKTILFTLLVIITPALIFLLTGCMKSPEINKEFGPEVSPEELRKTIQSIETKPVTSIKQGEFVYLERVSRVENQLPVVVRQQAETVTQKIENATNYIFTIDRQLAEYDGVSMKPSRSEYMACLAKVDGGCTAMSSLSLPSDLGVHSGPTADLSWRKVTTYAETTGKKTSYHNLKKVEKIIPVPTLAARRTDCGGLTADQCKSGIHATELSFDLVEWEGNNWNKTSYFYYFSKDVPFFASQLSACGSTTVPYAGQRVAVLQCDDVKDFSFGHD
ncbi:MAG: hypothetical protein BroJett040_05130 [Oligoflexia bacterium]|nr:MAG: hypothetical protein BroJett040_05130 [Oligoflexia bacterium]